MTQESVLFAVEIDFKDGVSSPETLLVRRVAAVIGSGEQAHVIIEGADSNFSNLEILRGVGRQFTGICKELGLAEVVFKHEGRIDLGQVVATVTPLDIDMIRGEEESLDEAGIRVIREAILGSSPAFPAVALKGTKPVVLSFQENSSIVIGRGPKSDLRIDASDVSGVHARFGSENGEFWVEDLNSTNGTFVGESKIDGRVFPGSESIRLGASTSVYGIRAWDELSSLRGSLAGTNSFQKEIPQYPCLIALSDSIRPSKTSLIPGQRLVIGRDPACDVWLGAAHVSRNHLFVSLDSDGSIELEDQSSNGTFVDDVPLQRSSPVRLGSESSVISFGEGVSMGICYSKSDEDSFFDNNLTDEASEVVESEVFETKSLEEGTSEEEVLSGDSIFAKMVADRELSEPESVRPRAAPTLMGSMIGDLVDQVKSGETTDLVPTRDSSSTADMDLEASEDLGQELYGTTDSRRAGFFSFRSLGLVLLLGAILALLFLVLGR